MHKHSPLCDILLCIFQISNNNEPKLTGFGSILYIDAPASRTMSGLSHYAPEVLMGRPYRWSSDVYSFGIVCSEMLLRHHVFADEELTSYNPKAFAVKLESEGYIHSVTKSDETRLRKELKDIEHCLHPRFEKRPNIADMLPK